MRVIQFAGPIADAWLDELRETGAQILQYVPDNAYLVLADEATFARVRINDALLHADMLPPWYKLDGVLAARARSGRSGATIDVTVAIARHPRNSDTKAKLTALASSGRVIFSPSVVFRK